MKKKKYSLTEEHKAQLEPWANKWIENALSTKPMDEEDRRICREAVKGLYEAAKLPPPKAIVFVPSPFVLRFAGGFAAWWWYCYHNAKNKKVNLNDATRAATAAATRDATDDATRDATYAATRAATAHATDAATYAATDAATAAATYDATRDATYAATAHATDDATYPKVNLDTWYSVDVGGVIAVAKSIFKKGYHGAIESAAKSGNLWQGGNQWSGWDSFLSFFKDVVGLPLTEYKPYQRWQALSQHSGPRIVHKDFCIISDRPTTLKVDNRNRPHCATGPFCEWRDGSKLYALHGVRVPAKYIELPVKAEELFKETNAQVRMAVIRKEGYGKFIKELKGKLISESPSTRGSSKPVQLWEVDLPSLGVVRLLKLTWHDTRDEQETFIAVPQTKSEFEEMFGLVPTDPNNAELVRLATMQVNTGTHEIVFES